MRMNDYEKGMQRGRTQRHFIGRIRWLVLILLLGNLFLIYKYWEKSAALSEEQRNSEGASVVINNVKYEQARCDKQNAQLIKDLEANGLQLQEIKNDLEGYRDEKRNCEGQLGDIGIEKDKAKSENRALYQEKEGLTAKLEQCSDELNSIKELVESLKAEVAKERRDKEAALSQANNVPDGQPVAVRTEGPKVPEVADKTEDEAKKDAPPVMNEIMPQSTETKSLVPGNENEEIQDVDNLDGREKKMECAFEQSPNMVDNCVYKHDEYLSSHWELKPANIIEDAQPTDEKHEKYLSLVATDEHTTAEAAFSLGPITTENCLEVVLNALLVDSGMILVLDGDKESARFKLEEGEPSWKVLKTTLAKPETANIRSVKIMGMVPSSGGIAISKVEVFAVRCPQDIGMAENPDKEGADAPDLNVEANLQPPDTGHESNEEGNQGAEEIQPEKEKIDIEPRVLDKNLQDKDNANVL